MSTGKRMFFSLLDRKSMLSQKAKEICNDKTLLELEAKMALILGSQDLQRIAERLGRWQIKNSSYPAKEISTHVL